MVEKVAVVVPLKATQIRFVDNSPAILDPGRLVVGDVLRQQNAELLRGATSVAPDKRGKSHVGCIEQLSSRLLGVSSGTLRRFGLGQACLNPILLGCDDGEGTCRIFLR